MQTCVFASVLVSWTSDAAGGRGPMINNAPTWRAICMQNDTIVVGGGHRVVKINQLRESWPSLRVYLVVSERCAIEEVELDSL